MEKVILLNSDYSFLSLIHKHRAITLVVTGKVEVLKATDKVIHNASKTFKMFVPAVVRLVKLARQIYKAKVPYSKRNVVTRDRYMCQYCGVRLDDHTATIDHIIPSSRGGSTSFENCAASCKACNCKKGNKTPSECGMFPLRKPYQPTIMEFVSIKMAALGVDKVLEDLWHRENL